MMAIDHRLRQVPSQTAGQLRVQVATNRGCRVATTSALHLSPSAQGVVNCLSSSTKRLPGERHKVQTLPATDRERLLKLLVVGILSRHPSFLHRNLNVFLLQWVRYGDVERRRGKAPLVLLHGDVSRLLVGPFDLVLLFCDDTCSSKSSSSISSS